MVDEPIPHPTRWLTSLCVGTIQTRGLAETRLGLPSEYWHVRVIVPLAGLGPFRELERTRIAIEICLPNT